MQLRNPPLLLLFSVMSVFSCRVVEDVLEGLAEVCAREAQVVTTFEEGDDEFRLCSLERCTLREAIVTANACGDGDVVQLSPGTYQLTSRDRPRRGNPRIESERQDDRVGPVGLPRITGDVVIRGAGATIERDPDVEGFRIFHILEGGHLTLEDVTVSNGWAEGQYGGAVYNEGTLTVTGSTLRGHRAARGGGAIYNAGSATLTRIILRENSTALERGVPELGGGAIYNAESATAEIHDSEFIQNSVSANGGALYNLGMITLETTSLTDNEAQHGGAIHLGGGSMTVEKSLVDGNTASGDAGGINIIDGNLVVRSSTISGNGASLGGGIAFQGRGSVQLHDVTITVNTTSAPGSGGGLNVGTSGPFETRNTLVAGNSIVDCASTGDFRARGENLDADDSCPGFTRRGDPRLGPLQDNGGATRTHALGSGSPAIDSGGDCLSQDQRGFRRPIGRCDIGAFEVQP